jgi:hypothetical protein
MTTATSNTVTDNTARVQVVTLLYVDHCVNWPLAAGRLRAALHRTGLDHVRLEWRAVHHLQSAVAAGFAGSPTVLIDGDDPFPRPVTVSGLCCRFYDTDDGLCGAPSVDQLVAALGAADPRERPPR